MTEKAQMYFEIYQSSLKLEQNSALVYQETPQRGDADISARKKLYWNPKDSGICPIYIYRPTNSGSALADN